MKPSPSAAGVCLALCLVACVQFSRAFVMPSGGQHAQPSNGAERTLAVELSRGSSRSSSGSSWGVVSACLAIGAQAGLAAALYGRTALRAEEKAVATKYAESATDAKLFEQVYHEYTREYMKGPMYWHEDKLQGFLPDYPGNPMFKNGKMTSNPLGNLKTFSSNELAFFSILFFAIGLYGYLQFNYYDPQFPRADAGENMNASYIVEFLCLPISFFFHIACYIQKKNGR